MDDSVNSDALRWARLLHWLENTHGMNMKDLLVEARSVEGAGRGLFATKAISPSTTLFVIPEKAMINLDTLASLYQGRRLSAIQMISLHLVLHRPQGQEDSLDPRFGPYISVLPREFASHPLTWLVARPRRSTDAIEALIVNNLPPSVHNELHTLYGRFLEDYQTVCLYLNENRTIVETSSRSQMDLPKPYGNSRNAHLIDDYCWAWLNVNTRSIYYPTRTAHSESDCLSLCPILDFANHKDIDTQITPVIESNIWSPGKSKPTGDYAFISCSHSNIEQNQQLFLRYGGHSNRTLIVEYGFANHCTAEEISNGRFRGEVDVQDAVEELLGVVKPVRNGDGFSASTTLRNWLVQTLKDEGYWGEWTLDSSPQPAHPSYRLITALRLFELISTSQTPMDPHQLQDVVQSWRDVLRGHRESISKENEQGWRDALLRICDQISRRAMAGLNNTAKDLAGVNGWMTWMRQNVEYLWREELEVANAVTRSIRAGEIF